MKGVSELGRLEVNIYCENCSDFAIGIPAGDSLNRCTECGCFATDDANVCCMQHELRSSPYPSGECPYCEQERDRRAQRQHQMTRDPTLEPY